MQSSGFANFMVKIIRKDWKQHGKMLLGLVGGMMLAPIVILITLPVLIALFSRRGRASTVREPVLEPSE